MFGHSVLCIEPQVGMGSLRQSFSFANGGQRGDLGTGQWDPGYSIAECSASQAVTGISRVPGAGLGALQCNTVVGEFPDDAHCTTLPFSISSDNRLNASTGDWAPNFVKNECGANQQLKGVSMNASTGEIHAVLCCNTVR